MAFLDNTGVERLWQHIVAKLGDKADKTSLESGDVVVAEATHAVSADSAENATKATQDGSGNVIASTYETKADADATEASLTAAINGKADASHTHAIADVTDLQTTLDTMQGEIDANESSISSHATEINTIKSHVGILSGEAYAIFDMSAKTLYFVRSEVENAPVAGEIFTASDGTSITCMNVYSGVETNMYVGDEHGSYIPWSWVARDATSVKFIDTIKPVSTAGWFQFYQNITSLDLSNLDTSNVINMDYMFYGCSGLTSLDVFNFDTSNVTSMIRMFYGCSSLTTLDLSSFDTSNVTSMSQMFYGCSSLTTLYASDLWSTDAVTSSNYMFYDCTALVGDIAYDSSYTDKTYATTSGGYLTYKFVDGYVLKSELEPIESSISTLQSQIPVIQMITWEAGD